MIEDKDRLISSDRSIPFKMLTIPKASFTQQDIEAYKERKCRWEQGTGNS